MDFSIIIPAFNEERKIAADIRAALEFLARENYTGEIVVVDDGSIDGTTVVAQRVGREFAKADILVKVVRYEGHRGKGLAVRTGIGSSTGKWVMFADSGSCVPYEYALRGLKLIESGVCDVAHGSRKLRSSIIVRSQSWLRRTIGAAMRRVMISYLKVPSELTDTQCGFKIYRGDVARRLYGQCVVNGFLFDIEIILRAVKMGYRIKEFPIQWTSDPDSRLAPIRNLPQTLNELKALRRISRALS